MAYSILSRHQLKAMRESCQLAAQTLVEVGRIIRPGLTTEEINTFVHDYTLKAGARPAPLNYHGFPKSVCTSVNDVICHGIPGPRVLEDGDIVNVDVTPVLPNTHRGWHGDTNATFYVGEPSEETKHLVEVTRECLERAIAVVKHGAYVGDIGAAIQAYAEANGCSVVRDYTGHGIGRTFHCEPSIPHFGIRGEGVRLKKGMCFTIEPMINLGAPGVRHLDDGWTALTSDGSLSAQFEHTLVVTKEGCEVLTARKELLPNSEDKPWCKLGPLASFTG